MRLGPILFAMRLNIVVKIGVRMKVKPIHNNDFDFLSVSSVLGRAPLMSLSFVIGVSQKFAQRPNAIDAARTGEVPASLLPRPHLFIRT